MHMQNFLKWDHFDKKCKLSVNKNMLHMEIGKQDKMAPFEHTQNCISHMSLLVHYNHYTKQHMNSILFPRNHSRTIQNDSQLVWIFWWA
jgi:hypothetical protein